MLRFTGYLLLLFFVAITGCGTEGGGTDWEDYPRLLNITPDDGAVNVPLDINLTAVFDRSMDKASVEAAGNILLKDANGQEVPAFITYNDTTFSATIDPESTLLQRSGYTVTFSKSIKSAGNTGLLEAYTWSFRTDDGFEVSTVGGFFNGAVNLPVNLNISLQFNKDMDPATFIVSPAASLDGVSKSIGLTDTSNTPVNATVIYNSSTRIAVIQPAGLLAPWTDYTLTLTGAIEDSTGNPLNFDYVYLFSTGGDLDTEDPEFAGALVSSSGTTSVTLSWTAATDDISPASGMTYLVYSSTESGSQNYLAPSYVTAPGAAGYTATGLAPATTYYFVVRARDEAGNTSSAIAEVSAATSADTDAPQVSAVRPLDGGVGAVVNTNIAITFDEAMDASTITVSPAAALDGTGILLSDGAGNPVTAAVTYNSASRTAVINPSADLDILTEYTVTVTTAVQDANGNGLEEDFVSSFTTGNSPDLTRPVFAGATGAVSAGSDRITLSWAAATDNISPQNTITYFIYAGTVSGAQNYATPSYATSPGAATFTATGLAPATTYYFVVRARDEAGNTSSTIAEVSAATVESSEAPVVTTFRPQEGAANVAVNTNIVIIFDKDMDASTLTTATVTLDDDPSTPGTVVAGAVTYNSTTRTVMFNPDANLAISTTYTFKLLAGIKDSTGNDLSALQFTFDTSSDPAP